MKIVILLIVMVGIVVAALFVRSTLTRAKRKHDPIEFYRGWGGYRHPIVLENKITKEEADAPGARGAVYLIGYFDTEGRLTRVVKFLRGEVFFEYLYAYHPNGRLKSARVARGGRYVARIRRTRPQTRRQHRVLMKLWLRSLRRAPTPPRCGSPKYWPCTLPWCRP
jgi:hypothetical protein